MTIRTDSTTPFLPQESGAAATATPTDSSAAISLRESLDRCERIERLQDVGEIHRQFDALSNDVLCSLGYSELVRRFLARVAEFHKTLDVNSALAVAFPYRDWRDDPNEARGKAQRVLESVVLPTPTKDSSHGY